MPVRSPSTTRTQAEGEFKHSAENGQTNRKEAVGPGVETSGEIPKGCRLLVVDDDIEMRTLVSRMCTCLGCCTNTAAGGKDALVYLQEGRFDLVITDYQMLAMDGFQLAAQIRRLHPDLPVIIMTGRYDHDLRERLQTTDLFNGLLEKPYADSILDASTGD